MAALALCLFTLWPLLRQPGLPNGTDTLYHIYRVAEMDRAWSHGVLMPRWAESFYFGYGSPLFQYYGSLAYYLASALMRLFGLDVVGSLRALTALSLLGAGGGMYLFMRDQIGRLAGVIAAVCFVYSPYLVYTEPYARGVYPELLSFALFPWTMWCYGRLLKEGRAWTLVAAALSSGILIITHNLMAAVLTGLLGAWLVWNLIIVVAAQDRAAARRCALALFAVFIGVGLAAYFWIPVVLEADAAPLDNLTSIALLDYRNFFVPLDRLLAFTPRADAGAVNGLLHQLNLGPAQWGLALVGVVGSIVFLRFSPATRQTLHWRFLIFFALASLGLIFLMLPTATGLWERFSPLSMLQFPWRLLGPALFCLSALAGLNALWIERLGPRFGAAAAALIIIPIATAMPMFFVPEWTNTQVDTSTAAYHRAELSGLQMATTYSNEYLPLNVQVMPGPTERLIADYADGYPVDKVHREALPQGVQAESLEHGPQHDAWRVSAETAFTMEVLTFYFPGWQAEIDGQPVPIYPSDPHGLITLEVPQGEHIVRVFLGNTQSVAIGRAVTAVSALALCAAAVLCLRLRTENYLPAAPLSPALRWGIVAGGAIQLALVLLLMRENLMWFASPPGEAHPAQHKVLYDLGGEVQLLGYDLNGANFRPGERIDLILYWYAPEAVDYGYASFVHVSNGGPPLAQQDKINPAGRPTLAWTSNGYYYDPYSILLPDTIPPGEYQLLIGLYTCDLRPPGLCGNGDRAQTTAQDGDLIGDAVPLAVIMVR